VIDRGVLAGNPMDDIRVSVDDGSYHDVDSSEVAFKIAGRLAFSEAARRAKPILIEPIMLVSVETPAQYRVRVMDALRARGGLSVIWTGQAEKAKVSVHGLVPLSQMFGFGAELNARTRQSGHVRDDVLPLRACDPQRR
jgi:elongation factor G